MTAPIAAARDYVKATSEAFWRWTDDGTVLAWTRVASGDGGTIAFLPEVQAVLERLSVSGLPPFSAVVMALAACRDQMIPMIERVVDGDSELTEKLRRFGELAATLRSGLTSKVALIEALFERSSDRGTPEAAADVVQGLTMIAPVHLTLLLELERTPNERFSARRSLLQAFRQFDPQTWALQSKTGLEAVPEKAPVELPLNERVRQLLDSLQDDEELSGIARLAQNLLAAVYVPRPVSSREHLPVGGVSDLSNRGSLDRLLLSELAHDDLTLAVRVALNEALYLRREAPPRNPPNVRFLLLDSGMRMWGLPRVFALAVALALAVTTDKQSALYAFQTSAGGLVPVDLGTRQGLLAVLENLTGTLHPGASLVEFVDELEEGEAAVDAILITSDDTLDDPDFQRVLAQLNQPLLAASVNRDGEYVLWALTRRERKQVASAQLNLEEIYQRADQLQVENVDPHLPAILSLSEFPLLLPHPRPERRQMRYVPGRGVIAVTNDGRLAVWERAGWGARQLTDRVPGKTPLWVTANDGHACVLLNYTSSTPLRLLVKSLDSAESTIHDLPGIRLSPRHIFEHRGQLFLLVDKDLYAVDLATAQIVSTKVLPPELKPHFGRVFWHNHGKWAVASYDGQQVRFDLVRLGPDNACKRSLVGLVDCEGQEGPVGITAQAGVFFTSTGELIERCHPPPQQPLNLTAVSHDGRRALLTHPGGRVLLDVQRGLAGVNYSDFELEPEQHRLLQERSLRVHFTATFVNAAGRLSLMSRKGQALQIELAGDRIALHAGPNDRWPGSAKMTPFEPIRSKEGTRYSLEVAMGSQGDRIYLDSRGLLHLRPADSAQPEVTLVLCEGTIAGWNSLHQRIGPAYYIGAVTPTSAQEFFHRIDRFATAWR